jgi:transcriptional regulator
MNVDDNAPATKADLSALEERILKRIEKSETNLLLALSQMVGFRRDLPKGERSFGAQLR